MTLQVLADKLGAIQDLAEGLPESSQRDDIVEACESAYRSLVACSGDLLALLSDLQDQAVELRSIMDAA